MDCSSTLSALTQCVSTLSVFHMNDTVAFVMLVIHRVSDWITTCYEQIKYWLPVLTCRFNLKWLQMTNNGAQKEFGGGGGAALMVSGLPLVKVIVRMEWIIELERELVESEVKVTGCVRS